MKGQLQIWTEHSHTDLWKSETSRYIKNHSNIIFKSYGFLISLLVSDFQRSVWECSVHSCKLSLMWRTFDFIKMYLRICLFYTGVVKTLVMIPFWMCRVPALPDIIPAIPNAIPEMIPFLLIPHPQRWSMMVLWISRMKFPTFVLWIWKTSLSL